MENLKQMKKYELHCHLDGSLPIDCVRSLAEENGVPFSEEKLEKELRVEEDCRSLAEYLTKFDLPLACLATEKSFTKAVKAVLQAAALEHVTYLEIRFAPMLSVTESLSVQQIIEGAIKGLEEGKAAYGIQGGLILCGMRHMPAEVNVEMVKTAGDYYRHGVCAVDLAGNEAAFPVKLHTEMFQTAKQMGIPFTIHAGECGSVQSIWDALELGAARIGHGIAAIQDKKLMEYCRDHRIPLELCPSSNLQTKAVASMEEYPFMQFLEAGIPVTIHTDNRTVSNTSMTKELELLQRYYHLSDSTLEELMENGRQAAFQ